MGRRPFRSYSSEMWKHRWDKPERGVNNVWSYSARIGNHMWKHRWDKPEPGVNNVWSYSARIGNHVVDLEATVYICGPAQLARSWPYHGGKKCIHV